MNLARRLMMRQQAAGSLWTPAEIATALWLDADDVTTITQSGGVTQWADKSGLGRNAAPPIAAKPTYTTSGINGRGSIVFPSTAAPLLVPSFTAPTGADGILVAWVGQKSGEPVSYSNPLTYGPTNRQWSFILPNTSVGSSAGASKCIWRNNDIGSLHARSLDDFGIGTQRVITATLKNTVGMAQYFEGNAQGTQVSGTYNLGSATSLVIGSSPDLTYSANRYQGMLGEIVVVYADISTGTRQLIEGYLAHKWGRAAYLPSSHPYKTIAP